LELVAEHREALGVEPSLRELNIPKQTFEGDEKPVPRARTDHPNARVSVAAWRANCA
jgi:hypothetical protein